MICAGKEKLLGRHTSDFQQQFYLLGMSSLLRNMKCFVLLVECFVLLVEGIGGGNTPVYTHTHMWNVLCCWWNVLCCWWNVLRCWGNVFLVVDVMFCVVDGMFCVVEGIFCVVGGMFCVVDGMYGVVGGRNWGWQPLHLQLHSHPCRGSNSRLAWSFSFLLPFQCFWWGTQATQPPSGFIRTFGNVYKVHQFYLSWTQFAPL